MPQGPIAVAAAIKNNGTANVYALLQMDPNGALIVTDNHGAEKSVLNITAGTVISTNAGFVGRVCVIVAGSGNGAIYDTAVLSGTVAANQIMAIPTVIATTSVDLPVANGIAVVPGTGQTLAVFYR